MVEEKNEKISFKEAVKLKLEAKKNKQSVAQITGIKNTKKLSNQQSKKVSGSHRKMGL